MKVEDIIKNADKITSILIFEDEEQSTDIGIINTNGKQHYIKKNKKHNELINIINKKDNFFKIKSNIGGSIFYININFVDSFKEIKGFPEGILYQIKLIDGATNATIIEEEYIKYNSYKTEKKIKNNLKGF